MDYKDTEKIIEAGEKRPKRTLFVLLVLLLLVSVIAFVTGYFREKGKRLAFPANQSQVISPPSSKARDHQKQDIPRPIINQHTEGNQSPAVNVAPGGTATFDYSSPKKESSKE